MDLGFSIMEMEQDLKEHSRKATLMVRESSLTVEMGQHSGWEDCEMGGQKEIYQRERPPFSPISTPTLSGMSTLFNILNSYQRLRSHNSGLTYVKNVNKNSLQKVHIGMHIID